MIKKIGATAARKVKSSAARDKANVRKALKSIASMTADMWQTLIDLIPKSIRLSIELIKSPKVGDKAKLILIGAVCVAGFVIAEEFINRLTVAPLAFLLFGPIAGVFAILFFDTVKIILLAATFFAIAKVFVDLAESDEVNRLSQELFGSDDSADFMAKIRSVYHKMNKFMGPLAGRMHSVFETIGKKKKKGFDPDEAGDVVIRATATNRTKLLEWSGTVKSEITPLLKEGK